MVQALTTDSFEQFVTANPVALVDFTATWCPPCQALKPILDELASEYDGKAAIAAVDVDEQAALASALGISSMPTVVVFKDGKVAGTIVGLNPKPNYKRVLDSLTTA